MAQCATTALPGAVPRLCVRGARGRFGGLGLVPGVVSLPFPPSRPACPALLMAGRPVRVSLTLARWYAIPRGLCVPRARSGCPSGLGVGLFVCLCAHPACAPPLLAGVCSVGVCLGSGFSCTPPLLAGVLGCACACVRAPLVPRHSWLGCALWVCVFGLGFRLPPATPSLMLGCLCVCVRAPLGDVPLLAGACVCLGSGFGRAPPLLVGVLGGVCACVRAPPVPSHSWLECAVWVLVLGLGLRLRPATSGWGVGLCVCLCARSACTPPLLAGVRGVGVCVLGSRFGCALPLLAGVLACVCVCVRTPLVPRLSWLGCAVWVCVFGLRLSAAPRHSWLGCWGVCVCVCVRARLVPRYSWLGHAVCGLDVAWHLFPCRGWLPVVRAARICGTRWPLLLGICPCALVVAGSVPLWHASWHCVGTQAFRGGKISRILLKCSF